MRHSHRLHHRPPQHRSRTPPSGSPRARRPVCILPCRIHPHSLRLTCRAKSAEDLSFEEIEAYLTHQAPLVAALYNTAAHLATQYRKQAAVLLEYGAALKAFGASEGGPVGEALTAAGLATWAGSTAAYEQAVEETELFAERLADTVRSMRAMQQMMAERTRASNDLATALSTVEALRAKVTALAASTAPTAGTERMRAESELTTATATATEARAYYDKVAAAVIREVERHKWNLRSELRSMLLDFVVTQQRNAAKVAAAWERAMPAVTAAVAGEGATPLPPGAAAAMMAARASSSSSVGAVGEAPASATLDATTAGAAAAGGSGSVEAADPAAAAAGGAGGAGGAATAGSDGTMFDSVF